MLATVIQLLITLVIIAIAVYLVLWVLEQIGIAIPPRIMQLIWLLIILLILFYLVTHLPSFGIRF